MDDYAPFPAIELEELATSYEEIAAKFTEPSPLWSFYAKRAAMLRNAVLCHEAVRDRLLNETAQHRGTLGRLQAQA